MKRFEGKVALVTGAGHGIGQSTAERLAEEGAAVAIFDLQGASAIADQLAAVGTSAVGSAVDVADPEAVESAVHDVQQALGPIDVLVNSAGFLTSGTALTQTWEAWRHTFAVNVDGVLATTKAVLPGMVERGDGAIVNVASVGGLFGVPGLVAYNASKGAVVNVTRQLGIDWRRQGVRVNCVCPGWVPTGFNDPMLEGLSDDDVAAAVDTSVPAGRQADPSEIAAAIAFLASDDASYVCGHALVVDGGATASV